MQRGRITTFECIMGVLVLCIAVCSYRHEMLCSLYSILSHSLISQPWQWVASVSKLTG